MSSKKNYVPNLKSYARSGARYTKTQKNEKKILKINQTGLPIVSIDIASGLFSDTHSPQRAVIQPTYTITFQL